MMKTTPKSTRSAVPSQGRISPGQRSAAGSGAGVAAGAFFFTAPAMTASLLLGADQRQIVADIGWAHAARIEHAVHVIGTIEQYLGRMLLPVIGGQRYAGELLRGFHLRLAAGQPDELHRQLFIEMTEPASNDRR